MTSIPFMLALGVSADKINFALIHLTYLIHRCKNVEKDNWPRSVVTILSTVYIILQYVPLEISGGCFGADLGNQV